MRTFDARRRLLADCNRRALLMSEGGGLRYGEVRLRLLFFFFELLSQFFELLFVAGLVGVEGGVLFFGCVGCFFLLMDIVFMDDGF